jgi:formate hydrogenlyase subunit 3/multisubunit Na+/H+ antiporter MnhD subunit
MASALMLAGLLAIFFGVAAGLAQRQAAALLAYSSISQMGYFTLAVGAGLLAPGLWPLLLPAVLLYAVHHALAKAALFLGLGVAARRGAGGAVMVGLAVPALALAGAPFSSGMLVKGALKAGWAALPAPWAGLLAGLMPLAAVGTALLMARLLWQVWDTARTSAAPTAVEAPGLGAPWLVLLLALAGLVWAMAPQSVQARIGDLGALLDASWPILAALGVACVALRLHWRAPVLPPGDVLLPMLRALAWLRRLPARRRPRWRAGRAGPSRAAAVIRLRLESQLRTPGVAGALWLVLLAVLVVLLG